MIKEGLGLDTVGDRATGEPEARETEEDLVKGEDLQGDKEGQEVTVESLVQTASLQTTPPQP